ncbi:MAG: DUF937 domain-containing protein [Clostridia bacterium]|nr:DUF937 domain-containing protein [Clostridia bacterium]
MDINSLMEQMLSKDTVKGLSKLAGTTQKSTKSVLASALPSLLKGAQSQAVGKDTATGFVKALSDHAAEDTKDLKSFMSGIDLDDGAKIVGHLLGNSAGKTAGSAAQEAGISQTKANSILSGAAPLLMSLLGQQASSGSNAQSNNVSGIGSLMGSLLGGTDLTGLLMGLVGGGSTGASASASSTSGKKKKKKKTDSNNNDSSAGSGILGSLLGLLKK